MMTRKQFLSKIKSLKKNWFLYYGTSIRTRDCNPTRNTFVNGTQCPYLVLSERDATKISFSYAIWYAADKLPGYDPKFRKELLKACKLKEKRKK